MPLSDGNRITEDHHLLLILFLSFSDLHKHPSKYRHMEADDIFIYAKTDQSHFPFLALQLFWEFESGLNYFERVTQLGN